MSKKVAFNLGDFEGISELQGSTLYGGFSQSFMKDKDKPIIIADNNCAGGNCVSGCGGNDGCNTIVGCGVKQ